MNEQPSWWSENKGSVGAGLQYAGIATKFIGDLSSAWGSYLTGKAQKSQYKIDAAMSRYRAGEYEADAKKLMESAGDEILEGRERIAARGLQLSQDIGNIYAGAAGSGIDVSSATVKHVEEGVRTQGYKDINAIARQNNRNAQTYLDQAVQLRKNAIWSNYDAKVGDINARLARRMGKVSFNAGILSAVGNLMGSIGGIVAQG